MLNVLDVHKSFGSVRAVRGVSFDIERGRVVALLGPNGSGKSTSIRMIAGFLPPDRGSIRVAGIDHPALHPAARRAVGYMPESTPLYPEMSVEGFLTFRARLWGLSGKERRAAVARAADRCSLGQVLRRRIGGLSKGYRQRVGLASAILHRPSLLMLDEPTSGLDPDQVQQTRSLVRELAGEAAVIVTSHVLAEIEQVCERILVIARGRIRADAPPDELSPRAARPAVHAAEVRGDASGLIAALPGVARVESAALADGWTALEVHAGDAGADLREPIARVCASAGLAVRELTRRRPGLESRFLDILAEAARDDAR